MDLRGGGESQLARGNLYENAAYFDFVALLFTMPADLCFLDALTDKGLIFDAEIQRSEQDEV
jgi:hypothetical protein